MGQLLGLRTQGPQAVGMVESKMIVATVTCRTRSRFALVAATGRSIDEISFVRLAVRVQSLVGRLQPHSEP